MADKRIKKPKGGSKPLKRHCLFCNKPIKIGLMCSNYCHQQRNYAMKKVMVPMEQALWEYELDQKELLPMLPDPLDEKAPQQIYGVTYHFRMNDAKRTRLEMWKEKK